MKFVYLACPLSPLPSSPETREGNLATAKALYRELCLAHPDTVFLAPWILNAEVFEETPEHREVGMTRNKATIRALAWLPEASLWLCGHRISTGMRVEAYQATKFDLPDVNLTPESWPR